MIDKIRQIEKYMCENFEEWGLDDPVEEGYLEEYESISGATDADIMSFENTFGIDLPKDFKKLYKYKDGSRFMCVLPCVIGSSEMSFCLMSLREIENTKKYFQNGNALLSDFPEYFSSQNIDEMRDERIKPYLFNKRWIPFAQYCDSCYLMLDFYPDTEGQTGQIICYIHDPDEIKYVARDITELIEKIFEEI